MTQPTHALEVALIQEHCKILRLPAVSSGFERLAGEAVRGNHTHLRFLDALLGVETQEREVKAVARRLRDARMPRVKTLEEFDFTRATSISASAILSLATGNYLDRKEPIIFLGDCGTGKTHLATGLCVSACQQRKKARFVTAAGLVNELLEAQHANQLGRALNRWARFDLVCIDELGYVPLAELGAELLFQVISDRAEKASVIITTNLPFSEWTKVFTNARLCKALLDRLTDRAHIIQTGNKSFRFRRTVESRISSPLKPGIIAEASRDASRITSVEEDLDGPTTVSHDKAPAEEKVNVEASRDGSRINSVEEDLVGPTTVSHDKASAEVKVNAEASRDASGVIA